MRDPLNLAPFLALAVLASCEGPGVPGPLPNVMTAVVSLEAGGYASLAIELPRPGGAPAVRAAPGILAVGPGWASSLVLAAEPDSSGDTVHRLTVTGLGPEGRPVVHVLFRQARVVGVSRDGVWVDDGAGGSWLEAEPRPGARPPETPVPGGSRHRQGPGHGFHVQVADGRLEMLLPKMDRDRWAPVLQGVDALLGSWWLTTGDLPDWEARLIDARFKQVAAITAAGGRATIDGRLGEWRDAIAVPVDRRTQVLSGEEYWSGARDASFGVAARRMGDTLFLAVRLRDDKLLDGEDALEFTLGTRTFRVPVQVEGGPASGDGWRAEFTGPVDYGTAVEIQAEAVGLEAGQLVLPLVVHYIDHDPDQGTTRMGTAAEASLVKVGFVEE